MRHVLRPLASAVLALALAGCVSTPLRLDHADRLIARPDFQAAAQAAPEWCRDALQTINQLELQIERK